MKFDRRTTPIEATQWFKNGDHPLDGVGDKVVDVVRLSETHPHLFENAGEAITVPDDAPTYTRLEGKIVRFFRHPDFPSMDVCDVCCRIWHAHGWIDQGTTLSEIVCPTDWVVTVPQANGKDYYTVVPALDFALMFIPA